MKKPLIKEKLRIDIRKEYPTLFAGLMGHDISAQHKFHDGGEDNIVLAFANDVILESWNEGATWEAYRGRLTWPPVQRGISRPLPCQLALHQAHGVEGELTEMLILPRHNKMLEAKHLIGTPDSTDCNMGMEGLAAVRGVDVEAVQGRFQFLLQPLQGRHVPLHPNPGNPWLT